MPMKNLFDIQDKVIVLTGAGGYLGRGYARALAAAGAKVVAIEQRKDKLDEAYKDAPAGIEPMELDITDEEAVKQGIAKVVEKYGRIDGLINNAAMNPWPGDPDADKQFVPYEDYPIALFRKEIDINLTGMMIMLKYVAPVMIKQKSGSVLNVASEVSVMAHDHRVYQSPGRYKSPAYTASKTAVVGLTRQWAARLGECVNAMSLGGVFNPAMPADFMKRFGEANMLGRMAKPGEYEATVIYFMSDASSFMTASNVVIDGGKHAW